MRTHSRIVLAHHLIFTLYGHWPPNDIRGSGSVELRDEKLVPLGPIHHGRRPAHEQPSRAELRAFHKNVEPLLNHRVFWIDDAKRQAVAGAFANVIRTERYTCWACAICSNHAHLVIRRHRDDHIVIWTNLAAAARDALRAFPDVGEQHPVFANRPYSVFCYTPDGVEGRITYVQNNPEKERLPPQHYDVVIPYDGWPFHKRRRN